MSEIFSFRLSKSNSREARALEIIQKRVMDGQSLRQIITEALLHYEINSMEENPADQSSVSSMLRKIIGLLSNNEQDGPTFNNNLNKSKDTISEQFALSIKREVKNGLRI